MLGDEKPEPTAPPAEDEIAEADEDPDPEDDQARQKI